MATVSGLSLEEPMDLFLFLIRVKQNLSASQESRVARMALGAQPINLQPINPELGLTILKFQNDLQSGRFTLEMSANFQQITALVTGQIGARLPSPQQRIDSPACPSPKTPTPSPSARFFPSFPEHVHRPQPIGGKKRSLSNSADQPPLPQHPRIHPPERPAKLDS